MAGGFAVTLPRSTRAARRIGRMKQKPAFLSLFCHERAGINRLFAGPLSFSLVARDVWFGWRCRVLGTTRAGVLGGGAVHGPLGIGYGIVQAAAPNPGRPWGRAPAGALCSSAVLERPAHRRSTLIAVGAFWPRAGPIPGVVIVVGLGIFCRPVFAIDASIQQATWFLAYCPMPNR